MADFTVSEVVDGDTFKVQGGWKKFIIIFVKKKVYRKNMEGISVMPDDI